ncbi:MAG TPA: phosphoribosylanthranilate isomerase [Candidatus Wunengus sp. YC60]|uniref:phosphoribosylanthranilate isomerase n=1 Tax=Candidatus Wunengus sp. YC60 TaxID=3367697 RepID=UPI0040265E5A
MKISLSEELIQVAGIIDDAEARMLVVSGVDYLGFPLRLPVHKEDISEEKAGMIIRSLKPPHYSVLITYLKMAKEIFAFCHQLGARMVQLHGDVSPDELANLRKLDSGLFIIKSLIVKDNNLSELESQLSDHCPYADAFITDTYDPETGACGATGKMHNWDISRRLVSISPKPVILAGGLCPDNVREAIQYVRPAGVDVHTGVESPDGRKDPYLVRKFVGEARNAFTKMNLL